MLDIVFSIPGLIGLLTFLAIIFVLYALFVPRRPMANKVNVIVDDAGLNINSSDPNAENIRKIIREFAPSLGKLNDLSAEQRDKLVLMFMRSGNPWNLRPEEFLPTRIIAAGVGFFSSITLALLGVLDGLTVPPAVIILLLTLFGYLYPYSVYNSAQQKRIKSIQRDLPQIIDLLVITMRSGKTFLPALAEVTPRAPEGALKRELEQMTKELSAGRATRTTLLSFANRAGSDEASGFAKSIIQAESLGSDVSETLARQSEASREAYHALIDKMVAKLNTKMFAVLAVTMVPALLLLFVAPGLSTFTNGFG